MTKPVQGSTKGPGGPKRVPPSGKAFGLKPSPKENSADNKAASSAAVVSRKPPVRSAGSLGGLFAEDPVGVEVVEDGLNAMARYRRLLGLLRAQAIAIGILAGIAVFAAPLLKPVNQYKVVYSDKQVQDLFPLFNPNLTDKAILSWTASSITEILTLGFGGFDEQIRGHRPRFTAKGWQAFQMAISAQHLRDNFLDKQLILTTVPSNSPVIVRQGMDHDGIYKWIVEMPILMTFATNNNVSKKNKSVIRLTIARVPSKENYRGIAINSFDVAK